MIFTRDNLEVENIIYNFEASESIILKLVNPRTKFQCKLLAVYRPPKNNVENFITDVNWWLTHANKRDENLILAGDINICLMKKDKKCTDYLNMLYSSSMIPTISKITREEILDGKLTVSSIDHINTRLGSKVNTKSAIIKQKLADHYFVTLTVTKKTPGGDNVSKSKNSKRVEIIDNKAVQKEIEKIYWKKLKDIKDPEDLYQNIQTKFAQIYRQCTKVKIIHEKDYSTPWVNE
ncbi:hypothetical protein WDU94_003525, partial [Cyamophila willieti]